MAYVQPSSGPGTVFVQPVRVGRRKNFGTLGSMEGSMSVCIGYTTDGKMAVWVPVKQLEMIRGAVQRARNRLFYKLLKRIIAYYERSAA
jgi:hypothetical protein